LSKFFKSISCDSPFKKTLEQTYHLRFFHGYKKHVPMLFYPDMTKPKYFKKAYLNVSKKTDIVAKYKNK